MVLNELTTYNSSIKTNNLDEIYGGATGIRTLETVSRLHTFQACAFDHSATAPWGVFRRFMGPSARGFLG